MSLAGDVVFALARRTRPVWLLRFCFVEVGLLMSVSTSLCINGVPSPGANEMLSSGDFL